MEEQIIFYEENPNLEGDVVDTFDGKKEYRRNCRKIKHEYYVKGKDCFYIDPMWYRVNSGLIEYNYTTKQYFVIKNKPDNFMKGIVGFDKTSNSIQLGIFTYDPYLSVKVKTHGDVWDCISQEVAESFCVEAPALGLYIPKTEIKTTELAIKNMLDNQQHTYNADDNVDFFKSKCALYKGFRLKPSALVAKFSRFIGDITFGAENECIRGYLPTNIQNQLGVIICRDGSLKDPADGSQGPEYTTVPLSGAKGVQTLITLSKELSKRNQIDVHCAFHLHIGNVRKDRNYIVSVYKLAYLIQEDIFKMFPYYKNNEVKFAGKNKNYCQKLEPLFFEEGICFNKDTYKNYINDTYLRIYKFLLEKGLFPSKKFNRKNRLHPQPAKWDRHSRYYWLNFINMFTSERNTFEFRIHTGTMNSQKMVTWLFICNAILKTAELKCKDLLQGKPISIDTVLSYYEDFYQCKDAKLLSDYLKAYYRTRCEYFMKDYSRNDYISPMDIELDKDFNFNFDTITNMFK